MAYIEGFVAAVPEANKDAYIRHATEAAPLFKEFGATRIVENWGDNIPDGKMSDFRGAVQAKPDEVVVFSWLEYPNRQARESANERITSDPRMKALSAMPFDGQRMIFGGFDPFVDETGSGKGAYIDGYLIPVAANQKNAYRDLAQKAAGIFKEYGAIRIVEAWGDDIRDGKVTDYRRAVKAQTDETVVYSWVEWPSKAARDAAWPKLMADERMKPDEKAMPFDGSRMVYGGFATIVDL